MSAIRGYGGLVDTYTESFLTAASAGVRRAVETAAERSGARGHFFFTDSELLVQLAGDAEHGRRLLAPFGVTPASADAAYERLHQPRTFPARPRPAQPNGDVAAWLEDAAAIARRQGMARFDARHVLLAMIECNGTDKDGERRWGSPLIAQLGPRRSAFEARLRETMLPPEVFLG